MERDAHSDAPCAALMPSVRQTGRWPQSKLSAVGLPVNPATPHRSQRAVFPHRALREYPLPRSLSPTVRLSLVSYFHARSVFPLLASYHVSPFPCERLSRSPITMS